MSDSFEEERELVGEKFHETADGLYLDPSLEYTVEGVDVIERRSMTGDGTEIVFVINVKTNNRAQLLGQVQPFSPGGFTGYFNNLYAGRIIEALEREFDIGHRFFVDLDVTSVDGQGYVDRHIDLQEAIEADILPEDSPLAEKMMEYGLSSLIIAGGTVITGPLAGSMENMERVCEEHDISTVLDMFCGSGALSKIALEKGADSVVAVDLDVTSARKNLQEHSDRVELYEMDAFDFEITEDYDLIITDPYYEIANDFIEKLLPRCSDHCNCLFMTVGFVNDAVWVERISSKIDQFFGEMNKMDTGRMIQVFAKG